MCIALILPVNRINKPSIKSTPFRNCNQIILNNQVITKGKTIEIRKKIRYDCNQNVLLYGLIDNGIIFKIQNYSNGGDPCFRGKNWTYCWY